MERNTFIYGPSCAIHFEKEVGQLLRELRPRSCCLGRRKRYIRREMLARGLYVVSLRTTYGFRLQYVALLYLTDKYGDTMKEMQADVNQMGTSAETAQNNYIKKDS